MIDAIAIIPLSPLRMCIFCMVASLGVGIGEGAPRRIDLVENAALVPLPKQRVTASEVNNFSDDASALLAMMMAMFSTKIETTMDSVKVTLESLEHDMEEMKVMMSRNWRRRWRQDSEQKDSKKKVLRYLEAKMETGFRSEA